MEEFRLDVRKSTPEEFAEGVRYAQLVHRFNHALPYSDEWKQIQQQLFEGKIGENVRIMNPLNVVRPNCVSIGNNSLIMNGCLMMAAGGITIEDDVLIAANVQLISNNHDPYDRIVLLCKPVRICKGAWVGAGSTILPGVTVGKHAIVGASSVVTHDVPDYAVAVGNPARIIKYLDRDKFEK